MLSQLPEIVFWEGAWMTQLSGALSESGDQYQDFNSLRMTIWIYTANQKLRPAPAQTVQLAPKVRNRNVLRVSGKRGLPLNEAAPLA